MSVPGSGPDPAPDHSLALVRWLLGSGAPPLAVLACRHAPAPRVPADAVGVVLPGCLDDLDVGLPAQLLACGVREVRVAPCPEHPAAAEGLARRWSRTLDGVTHGDVGAAGRPRRSGTVVALEDGPPVRASVSRRGLLGLARGGEPPFDLSLDEPGRGIAALAALRREGRARASAPSPDTGPSGLPAPDGEAPVATLLVASGCIACGVCVRGCPHDALHLTEPGTRAGFAVLRHRRADCRGEQECIRLCPEDALASIGSLSLLDLAASGDVELTRVETRACARCSTPHPAGEGDLCPTCAYRRAHPFGSVVRAGPRPDPPPT
ncbi:4Fe-4S dicluster domain-containing protein [Nocardioides sp. YIM 152588]|uniref:4Fe-4S dicluster domain-containing protein n=1 Tax=Nocardioides sp. YIM 152588 TaxID=3158259 RepID=UPI0032E48E38